MECEYRTYDRLLTEQFIGGLNDNGIIDEILREVTMLVDIEEAISACVLTLVHRLEANRAQRSALNNIKEAKEFDAIWQNTQKCAYESTHGDKCTYFGLTCTQKMPCIQEEMQRNLQS